MSLWSSVLDASRAIDWDTAGVSGGIPSASWTQCGGPLSPGVTAAQINSAMAGCAANTYVQLTAGTFALSAGLAMRSNVVLRGAGADQTKIVFTGSPGASGCFVNPGAWVSFCSGELNDGGKQSGGSFQHSSNWTGGYAKGTTVVTLSSATGLQVGNHLMLDQTEDTVDSGDIYICNESTACTGEGGNTWGRAGRSQIQVVGVVSCSPSCPNAGVTTVTIDTPLHMPNWQAGKTPGAWWGNLTIVNSGIERLSLEYPSAVSEDGILLHNAYNCWVKGVRAVVPSSGGANDYRGVRILIAGRVTVRDSYFYGSTNFATPVSQYQLSTEVASSVLVENNILQRSVSAFVPNDPESGNVYSYNYVTDVATATGIVMHSGDGDFALWEGNSAPGFTGDDVHGHQHFSTQFRNHLHNDTVSGYLDTANWLQAYHRFANVVGNVIGGTIYTVYERDLAFRQRNEIFSTGDKRSASYPFSTDPRVRITLLRWGNYDTVNGAVRFVASENPSTLTNFANLANPSQTLPPSFYLAAQPTTWWGTPWGVPPWPAIGPDVTGGDVSGFGGHVNKIPAQLCYENMPLDTVGYGGGTTIRTFNDATCYIGGAAPTPSPSEPLGTFPVTKTAPRGVFVMRHR